MKYNNNQNKGRSGRSEYKGRSDNKNNDFKPNEKSKTFRSKSFRKNDESDFGEKPYRSEGFNSSRNFKGTARKDGRFVKREGFGSSERFPKKETNFEERPPRKEGFTGSRNFKGTVRKNDRFGKDDKFVKSDKFGQNERFPKKERDENYDPNAKYSRKKQIEYKKLNAGNKGEMRLNRFLANAGICSRREADDFIKAGVVTVNGQIVTEMGTRVTPADKVMFHDQLVRSEKKVYILVNKPKDCVTTSDDPQERFTVMDIIKDACSERVYPVGRLDRNTTGVLLLTNDGDLAARLTHPKYNKKKIYHVFLDKPLTKQHMQDIADGVQLEDGEIHADKISYADEADKKQVGIEIHSGRNRIVRRIFEHLGYKVEKLDRVYFAGLTKKNLSRGRFRFLTNKEVNMLSMGAYE